MSDIAVTATPSSSSSLSSSHLPSIHPQYTQELSQNEETLCTWDNSLVHLSGCDGVLRSASFNVTSLSALSIESASSLNITDYSFYTSTTLNLTFPSVQHNIRCTGNSSVAMNTFNGAPIETSTSLWMTADTCEFSTDEAVPLSLFFTPQLREAVGEHRSQTIHQISFAGLLFIPCSIAFMVYKDGQPTVSTPLLFDTHQREDYAVGTVTSDDLPDTAVITACVCVTANLGRESGWAETRRVKVAGMPSSPGSASSSSSSS